MDLDPTAPQRYLDELRRLLSRLPQAERDDAVKEIGAHISEARRAGLPLAAVLARLGDAALLARAYEADYLLAQPLPAEPAEPVGTAEGRVVRIVGPVLDVQFASAFVPEIHQALEIQQDDGQTLVLEVQQLLGNTVGGRPAARSSGRRPAPPSSLRWWRCRPCPWR